MNYKKIEKRVMTMFENCELDTDLLSTNISKDNVAKLLDYQILHTINLISCLKSNDVILDGSNTGTGKTYTSLCACKELGLKPLIICNKSVISVWRSVCDYFGVIPLAIINYETIRTGRTRSKNKLKNKLNKSKIVKGKISNVIFDPDNHINYESDNNDYNNDYNNDNNNDDDYGDNNKDYIKINENDEYEWNLNKRTDIVIVDEAHKCKNHKSLNGKLLISLKSKCKIIMLSATIADKPENFKVFGYMLGFYPSIEKSKGWINGILREDNDKLNKKTSSLYDKLYPYKGSRMSLDDIGVKFPKNQISAYCYSLSKSARREMDEHYKMIIANKTIDNINIDKRNENSEITTILRSRQKIELLKIPILIDLIDKYIESNKYVVVFINYLETLSKLSELLTNNDIQHSKLHGSLNEDERTVEINKFQTNSVKVILCMMQVGSQSISLHDTSGKAPRVSLIIPSFSSIDLIQALGRIYRVGLKTPVMQRIILCEDTYEKLIAEKIRNKLKFSTHLSECDNNNQMTKNLVNSLGNNDLL